MNYHFGQIKQEIQKVECDKCKGLGVILYKKVMRDGDRKLIYEYAARCNCQNGQEFIYDGTKINDKEHRTNFYIADAQKIGICTY